MSYPPLATSSKPLTKRLAAHLLRRCTYNFNVDRIIAFTGLSPVQAVNQLFDFSNPTRYSSGPLDWNHGVDEPIFVLENTNQASPSDFSENQRGRATILWTIFDALYDTTSRWKVMHWLHTIFPVRTQPKFFHYWKLLEACIETDLKTIAIKMTTDSSMMTYLNNDTNTITNFNENFAREVLELMTIQKGPSTGLGSYTNYTETDIANAAKVLTGYTLANTAHIAPAISLCDPFNPELFHPQIASAEPDPSLHDFSEKVFSLELSGGQLGDELKTINADPLGVQLNDGLIDINNLTPTQIEDLTNRMYEELKEFYTIVYDNPETAKSLVKRMYMFFVRDEIDSTTNTEVIEPLAQDLIDHCYDHIYVLKKLLTSNHFYDLDDQDVNNNDIIGGKIKSPWELLYQSINLLDIEELADPANGDTTNADLKLQFSDYFFIVGEEHLRYLGLNPRGPDTVEGYPGFYDEPKFSKNWFSSSNMYRRYTLAESFKGNYEYEHPTNSIYTQAFPFIVDLLSFVEQFEVLDGSGNPDPGDDPPSFAPQGVADASHLVTEILAAFLPETVWSVDDDDDDNDSWSQDRYNYFLNALLGGLDPVNWYFSWKAYLAVKDNPNDSNYNEIRNNVMVGLERLFDAILSSPEFQTY